MLNEKVQSVIDNLSVIYGIVDEGSFVTVFDADGVVRGFEISEGQEPLLPLGTKMDDPSGAFNEVVRTGKKKFNYLPKEVMGVAFKGVLVPIKDDGKVVGVIIYTHSVEMEEQVMGMTQKYQNTVNEVTKHISDMSNEIETLFQKLNGMNELTGRVEADIQKATDVVGNISRNASRSNILALNASIEAARSGEAGRGFAVVATEMGKLANDSGSSAKEIGSRLSEISNHMQTLLQGIQEANGIASENMENVSGMQEMLMETMKLASELERNMSK